MMYCNAVFVYNLACERFAWSRFRISASIRIAWYTRESQRGALERGDESGGV